MNKGEINRELIEELGESLEIARKMGIPRGAVLWGRKSGEFVINIKELENDTSIQTTVQG